MAGGWNGVEHHHGSTVTYIVSKPALCVSTLLRIVRAIIESSTMPCRRLRALVMLMHADGQSVFTVSAGRCQDERAAWQV